MSVELFFVSTLVNYAVKEFEFELQVCAWAERAWPSTYGDQTIVARQLGTRNRRWDTIIIETSTGALGERAPFGSEPLDSDLLFIAQHAPVSWAYYRDVLPDPGFPWRYIREAIHEAADRQFIEKRYRSGRIEIRRQYAYPDWVNRIIAIENKPDLNASAARRLADQLERDVALSLADEVWLATQTTGKDIEPALLETIPVEVGILSVPPKLDGTADVIWNPRRLPVESPGTRILDRPSNTEFDHSAASFEYVERDWKANKRLEIAERAYGRGWRSYITTMRPDCRYFQGIDPRGPFPWCEAKDRQQTAAECSGRCCSFEPEPPAWRQHGWPLSGGPGRALQRLLKRKRRRQRNLDVD